MNNHETWLSIFTDSNHIVAELLWTLIQDVVFIGVLYKIVFKKYILPNIRRQVHEDIDREHGITHE